jgi:hypothetical protein
MKPSKLVFIKDDSCGSGLAAGEGLRLICLPPHGSWRLAFAGSPTMSRVRAAGSCGQRIQAARLGPAVAEAPINARLARLV